MPPLKRSAVDNAFFTMFSQTGIDIKVEELRTQESNRRRLPGR
jgi:hypothetical protein